MLPGMRRVVGQPDLHPGNQYPIGATFITQKFIYPALIGNDIVSHWVEEMFFISKGREGMALDLWYSQIILPS